MKPTPDAWIVYTDGGSHTFRTEAEAQYERDEFERHMQVAGQRVVHQRAEPLYTRANHPDAMRKVAVVVEQNMLDVTYGTFRSKRGATIDAYRFNNYAGSRGDRPRWVTNAVDDGKIKLVTRKGKMVLTVAGEYGVLNAAVGDWVIRYESGNLDVYNNASFKHYYEVDDAS